MNYSEVNLTTKNALKREKQRSVFSNHWEASGKVLSTIAIKKDSLKKLGNGESFIQQSSIFPVLLDGLDIDELSITDLTFLSQAAKAIEDGDPKAATFVRDTSGGKPVDKQQYVPRPLTELPDNALDYLIEHGVVSDEDDDDE